MRVILYCRVSSEEQKDGTSLDFQERVLREYCSRNNYEVIHCCREDFSAKHHDFRRPQMRWLRDYCRKNPKEVDLILFLRWDRFSRNTEFAHAFKRIFMDGMGIRFNAIENPIDFETTEWSTLFNVYAGVAQTENSKISRRTRDGIRETLLKGKCANKAPRGYKNVRISKHDTSVEINHDVAPLIRKIFTEVAKGLESPNYIRKKYARNIPETSYFEMLRNPFYMGKVRVPAYNGEAEKLVDGLHEPLISEDTFYKVQDILNGRKRKSPKLSKPQDPMLFLRKFLICPICGHCLTGATSKGNGGKYTYYFCCNDPKHIRMRAEAVNDGFLHYLSVLKPYKGITELYNEILNDIRMGDKNTRIRRTELLKEELNAVIKRMDSVQDKYIDGDIDKETYNRIMERYSREADSVKERITLLETQNNAKIEPKMGYAISLINNIDRFILDAPVALKIKLLGSMFPEKIEFDGKKYRTKNYNKVLDFIYQQTNELQEYKTKNGESLSTFSVSVARPGIEPGTS